MTEQELRRKLTILTQEVLDTEDAKLVFLYAFALAQNAGFVSILSQDQKAHQSLLDDICAQVKTTAAENWKKFRAHIATADLLDKIKNQGAGNA